jgi:hypothetical protein
MAAGGSDALIGGAGRDGCNGGPGHDGAIDCQAYMAEIDYGLKPPLPVADSQPVVPVSVFSGAIGATASQTRTKRACQQGSRAIPALSAATRSFRQALASRPRIRAPLNRHRCLIVAHAG